MSSSDSSLGGVAGVLSSLIDSVITATNENEYICYPLPIIVGDRLGYGFLLRFLSYTEIGSRDPSWSLCNVNMFCIVSGFESKSESVPESFSGNANEPLDETFTKQLSYRDGVYNFSEKFDFKGWMKCKFSVFINDGFY